MRWLFAIWLSVAATFAAAEDIVLGLSEDEVALTITFDGQDLLIFGAVSRIRPPPLGRLGVIITVSGPLTPVTVRRQERVLGIWMNRDQAMVDSAPSFYAVSTTHPVEEILSAVSDLRHSVTIPRAIRSVGNRIVGSENFTEALIRIRSAQGVYFVQEGAVDLDADTLFRTEIELPANLIEGDYSVRIFLTRERRVVDRFETVIPVEKVGLERWLFNLSRNMSFAYGILSLTIAVAAGWLASAVFQYLRR